MGSEIEQIESLLDNTSRIVKHQEEIKILRGENFNIFSILKMESKENGTHSAIIGELLNPHGSHYFKTIFLEHFLRTIDYHGKLETKTANLVLEKHIGTKNNDSKSGGRIDIYIYDAKGNTVSIENKIYANDQENQIERYINHNKSKNTVYYLTLNGIEASEKSKSESIREGIDYFCISYKNTIIEWLEYCLKDAVEQPILRESIKQYILLIKKLTNQLNDAKMSKEIKELIRNNYYSAKTIEANVSKVELEITYQFLLEIKNEIEKVLLNNWHVIVDEDLHISWTGLKIEHANWGGIQVKLEGQSKITWQESVYGINANNQIWDRQDLKNKLSNIDILQNDFKESNGWPFYKTIINFSNTDQRIQLFDDQKRHDLVIEVSEKLIELAQECEIPLSNIKRIHTNS